MVRARTEMSEQRIPKQVMEWLSEERKKRGRSKVTWHKGTERATTERGVRLQDWQNKKHGDYKPEGAGL